MTTAAQRAAYSYSYVEPHPSVPVSQKLSTGRGGAGNATRLSSKSTTAGANATGPASRTTLPSPSISALRVGRGGAGNIKGAAPAGKGIDAEPTVFELDHDSRHLRVNALGDGQRVWHYGRGGQGNVLGQRNGSIARKSSDASSVSSRHGSVLSSISGGSERGGERRPSRLGSFVDKIRRTESNNQ